MNITPLRTLDEVLDSLIRESERRHGWLGPASEQVRRWKEEDRDAGIEWGDAAAAAALSPSGLSPVSRSQTKPPAAIASIEEIKAKHPRWEYIKFEYGRWTSTHENYDCSWEGEEDGWVDNNLMAEGRTLDELEEDMTLIEEERGLA